MGIIKQVCSTTGKVTYRTIDGAWLDMEAARSGLGFGHYHVHAIEWV